MVLAAAGWRGANLNRFPLRFRFLLAFLRLPSPTTPSHVAFMRMPFLLPFWLLMLLLLLLLLLKLLWLLLLLFLLLLPVPSLLPSLNRGCCKMRQGGMRRAGHSVNMHCSKSTQHTQDSEKGGKYMVMKGGGWILKGMGYGVWGMGYGVWGV